MGYKPFILLACIAGSLPVCSQSKKIALHIQPGTWSSEFIRQHGGHHLHSATETRHHKCIILNAALMVRLPQRWRAGVTFTYDHFGTKLRSVEYSNISYLLRADRIWKEGDRISFYSGLAGGVRKTRRFENEQETGRYITGSFHLYLAGAEIRINRFLYADLNAGWGACGILSAGVQCRF